MEAKKWVVKLKRGEVSENGRYGITSLDSQVAGPAELLGLFQEHWGVEKWEFQ
jgi:hypothetical protein